MIEDDLLYRSLGSRIRSFREQASGANGRMTQGELAAAVGLERTSITNIEKGVQKVPLHTLFRIGKALSVSVGDLLADIEPVRVEQSQPTILPFGGKRVVASELLTQAIKELGII